jgi:catechol 2,3-dioxygenase-like lactoylglutathione lyase family enzyme
MINGAHVILYTTDAEADRAFIRDVLGFALVDAGNGWLIFKLLPLRSLCILPMGWGSTSSP